MKEELVAGAHGVLAAHSWLRSWLHRWLHSWLNRRGEGLSLCLDGEVEGRYPLLDPRVVQEFLWLQPELKNQAYKALRPQLAAARIVPPHVLVLQYATSSCYNEAKISRRGLQHRQESNNSH